MFSTNIHGNFKRFGMIFSLAFGFMILSVINTQAQYRDPNYYPQGNQNDQNRREQRRERRDNDDHDRNNGSYNRGNRDNDERYEGNRRTDNGYYGNNGNYGNNIYHMAQQYGYQDGLNKGAEEAREGDRYNPQGTSPYKNATNGYDRSYGNREQYKQAYRQAFLQGFDQGYNQYNNRSNRNGNYNNRNRRGY